MQGNWTQNLFTLTKNHRLRLANGLARMIDSLRNPAAPSGILIVQVYHSSLLIGQALAASLQTRLSNLLDLDKWQATVEATDVLPTAEPVSLSEGQLLNVLVVPDLAFAFNEKRIPVVDWMEASAVGFDHVLCVGPTPNLITSNQLTMPWEPVAHRYLKAFSSPIQLELSNGQEVVEFQGIGLASYRSRQVAVDVAVHSTFARDGGAVVEEVPVTTFQLPLLDWQGFVLPLSELLSLELHATFYLNLSVREGGAGSLRRESSTYASNLDYSPDEVPVYHFSSSWPQDEIRVFVTPQGATFVPLLTNVQEGTPAATAATEAAVTTDSLPAEELATFGDVADPAVAPANDPVAEGEAVTPPATQAPVSTGSDTIDFGLQ